MIPPLVILAGGQSRRMGRDKAGVMLNGERLIDRAIRRFAPHFEAIYLSAPHDHATGRPFIVDDPTLGEGPAAALYSVAAHLRAHGEGGGRFVTIPVDAPLVDPALLLALAGEPGCAIAAEADRDHPTIACWTTPALMELAAREASPRSLHAIARECRAERLVWSDGESLANANDAGELARIAASLR